jgi:hypothetical protein
MMKDGISGILREPEASEPGQIVQALMRSLLHRRGRMMHGIE